MPLTDTTIRNAKPRAKPYKLADSGGLFLYIAPTGGKLWRLKDRLQGRGQLLSLRAYPARSLPPRRRKRDEARKDLADGKSPSLERKRAAVAARDAQDNTFAKIAEELIAKRVREGL